MGFFGAPPPPSPPTRFDTVGVSASSILLLCAVLCVRNSLRSDGIPSAGIVYQVVGFLINIVSVSIPGRFDSDVDPTNMTFPWPTLFAPAGFAFAIWGVIYLGELLGMGLLVTSPRTGDQSMAPCDSILNGKVNLVLQAPTGSGKTLVAEVLILRMLLGSQQPRAPLSSARMQPQLLDTNRKTVQPLHFRKKCIFVVPYRALVEKTTKHLKKVWEREIKSLDNFYTWEFSDLGLGIAFAIRKY